jgi:hypothetical protein
MAFILLARDKSEITQEIINAANEAKENFSQAFHYATGNMAYMDTSYPIITMIDESLTDEDFEYKSRVMSKITNKFYETNPDDFDFITIHPVFEVNIPGGFAAYHLEVKRNIQGIGRDSALDATTVYGSKGKLLGLNIQLQTLWTSSLLHETGHYWCCYVGDDFAQGKDGAKLEIIQQGIHFYRGLQSPYETGTPMNSDNWVSNGDGTFRREDKEGIQRYHPFQLYFMGLLPKEEYATKFWIYDAGLPASGEMNFEHAVPYKQISVNDIIDVTGERTCIPYYIVGNGAFPYNYSKR